VYILDKAISLTYFKIFNASYMKVAL